ncbi:Tc toxin subunit A-related protein [Nitrospira sp. Ecomares 2.1]
MSKVLQVEHSSSRRFGYVVWSFLLFVILGGFPFKVLGMDEMKMGKVGKEKLYWEAKGLNLKTPPTEKLQGMPLPETLKVQIQNKGKRFSLVLPEGDKEAIWVKTIDVAALEIPGAVEGKPFAVKRGNYKAYYKAALESVQVSAATKKTMANLETMAQFRKELAGRRFQVFEDAKEPKDPESKSQRKKQDEALREINQLRKFSLLSLLAQDDKLTTELLKNDKLNVQSVRDLEQIPPETLFETLQSIYPDLGEDEQEKVKEKLNQQVGLLQKRARALRYLTDLQKLRNRQKIGVYKQEEVRGIFGQKDRFKSLGFRGKSSPKNAAVGAESASKTQSLPDCSGINDLFSPNTYLLYVLDFFSNYFDSIHGQEVTLDGLSKAFHQDLGSTICHAYSDPNQTWSHVNLTNQILENLLARLLITQKDFSQILNPQLGEDWERDFKEESKTRRQVKETIYNRFSQQDDYLDFRRDKLYPDLSPQERKKLPAFEEGLLGEWFDRLVNEFGVSRSDLQLAGIHPKRVEEFLKKYEEYEWTKENLLLLNLKNSSVRYKHIGRLKNFLWQHLLKKAKIFLEKEWVNDRVEIRGREFEKEIRGRRKKEQELIWQELVAGKPGLLSGEQISVLQALVESKAKPSMEQVAVLQLLVEGYMKPTVEQTVVLQTLIKEHRRLFPEQVAVLEWLLKGNTKPTAEQVTILQALVEEHTKLSEEQLAVLAQLVKGEPNLSAEQVAVLAALVEQVAVRKTFQEDPTKLTAEEMVVLQTLVKEHQRLSAEQVVVLQSLLKGDMNPTAEQVVVLAALVKEHQRLSTEQVAVLEQLVEGKIKLSADQVMVLRSLVTAHMKLSAEQVSILELIVGGKTTLSVDQVAVLASLLKEEHQRLSPEQVAVLDALAKGQTNLSTEQVKTLVELVEEYTKLFKEQKAVLNQLVRGKTNLSADQVAILSTLVKEDQRLYGEQVAVLQTFIERNTNPTAEQVDVLVALVKEHKKELSAKEVAVLEIFVKRNAKPSAKQVEVLAELVKEHKRLTADQVTVLQKVVEGKKKLTVVQVATLAALVKEHQRLTPAQVTVLQTVVEGKKKLTVEQVAVLAELVKDHQRLTGEQAAVLAQLVEGKPQLSEAQVAVLVALVKEHQRLTADQVTVLQTVVEGKKKPTEEEVAVLAPLLQAYTLSAEQRAVLAQLVKGKPQLSEAQVAVLAALVKEHQRLTADQVTVLQTVVEGKKKPTAEQVAVLRGLLGDYTKLSAEQRAVLAQLVKGNTQLSEEQVAVLAALVKEHHEKTLSEEQVTVLEQLVEGNQLSEAQVAILAALVKENQWLTAEQVDVLQAMVARNAKPTAEQVAVLAALVKEHHENTFPAEQVAVLKQLVEGKTQLTEEQVGVLSGLVENHQRLSADQLDVLQALVSVRIKIPSEHITVLQALIESQTKPSEEQRAVLKELIEWGTELSEDELQALRGKARNCLKGGTEDEPNQDCWLEGQEQAGEVGSKFEKNPYPKMEALFRFYYNILASDEQGNQQKVDDWIKEEIRKIRDKKWEDFLKEIDAEAQDAEDKGVEFNRAESEAEAKDRIEQYLKSDEGAEQELQRLAQREFAKLYAPESEMRKEFDNLVKEKAKVDWHQSVGRAESGLLERIRNNLLIMAVEEILKFQENNKDSSAYPLSLETMKGQEKAGELLQENIANLGKYLFLDLTIFESKKVPPLSFTIDRVHSFYQMVELEEDKDKQEDGKDRLYVFSEPDQIGDRQKTWAWLKSYGIWHAAMMVTMHPNHFLFTELRPTSTPQFHDFLKDLDDGVNTQEAFENLTSRMESFTSRELQFITLVEPPARFHPELEGQQFIFVWDQGRNLCFYSVLTPTRWIPWRKVPINFNWKDGKLRHPYQDIPFQIVFTESLTREDTLGHIHFIGIGEKREFDHEQFPKRNSTFSLLHASLSISGHLLGLTQGLDEKDAEATTEASWSEIEGLEAIEVQKEETNFSSLRSFALKSHGQSIAAGKHLTAFLMFSSSHTIASGLPKNLFITRNFLLKGNGEIQGIQPVLNQENLEFIIPNSEHFGKEIDAFGSQFIDMKSGYLHSRGNTSALLWKQKNEQWFSAHFIWSTEVQLFPTKLVTRVRLDEGNCKENGAFESFKNTKKTVFYCAPRKNLMPLGSTLSHNYGVFDLFEQDDGREDPYKVVLSLTRDILKERFQNKPLWYTSNGGILFDNLSYRYPAGSRAQLIPRGSVSTLDPAMVYLDELGLHAPLAIAQVLRQEEKYKEAIKWLGDALKYMESKEFQSDEISRRAVGLWLEKPFNPYALAELSRDVYLIHVQQELAATLTDWADHLFTLDTAESVNRARKLYDEAGQFLRKLEAPVPSSPSETENRYVLYKGRQSYEINRDGKEEWPVIQSGHSILGEGSTTNTETSGGYWRDPVAAENEEDGVLSEFEEEDPFFGLEVVDLIGPLPDLLDGPALQESPMIALLRWRVNSGLEKIRSHLNFAGFPRQLQPYATPVDPEKLVRAAAAGDLEFEQFIPNAPPPIYRFSFLLDHAKYLVSVAQQFQGSMLAALEKFDAESYTLLRARQDSQLAKAQMVLQSLRMTEARHGVKQAAVQLERMEFQRDHYDDLLDGGISDTEWAALGLSAAAQVSFAAGAIESFSTLDAGKGFTALGHGLQGAAAATASFAAWKRREGEWKFQRDLSNFDIEVANFGINLAEARSDIVGQEKEIAQVSLENTKDTIEFLGEKFFNTDLYNWMGKQLRKLYRHQLNMAIATANGAQQALEFERQTSLDFIGQDYWDDSRKGLLGSEHLLADLDKMEEFRLQTAVRKREIEKTISLAAKAPLAFQRFKETGVLEFATLPSWFESDFPGHYLRLIRDVRVSMLALVPPVEGIHATLSHDGVSWVMAGPPFDEPSPILRQPEAISLDRANQATGLFDLQPTDPMLLPFEGSGVAGTWRLELPKGANRFDFNSIADVQFTLRYTALEDRIYRKKILEEKLGQDEEGYVSAANVRVLSIRTEFPDQWYRFTHGKPGTQSADVTFPHKFQCGKFDGKEAELPPHTMVLPLTTHDFIPHELRRRITGVTAMMQLKEAAPGEAPFLPVALTLVPNEPCVFGERRETLKLSPADDTEKMDFMPPYGNWVLQLNLKDTGNPLVYPTPPAGGKVDLDAIDLSNLQDIVLGIEYKAKVHYPQ